MNKPIIEEYIKENALNNYKATILNSKTFVWNVTMRVFEMESYAEGTKSISYAVHRAYSLSRKGDSVTAINKLGLQNKVSYIITGGGAMLDCLEGKILPGVSAILENSYSER